MGKLTADAIVERALEIGDAEGLDSVTIRRLATDLGVTPMALYWHFKNKEQLLAGMADHLVDGFAPRSGDGRPWQEELRELVEGLIRVLRRHPCAKDVLEQTDHTDVPSFLKVWNGSLGLARSAGFGPKESCLISRFLLEGAISIAGSSGHVHRRLPDDEAAELRRVKRLRLQSLPVGVYPYLVEMAEPMAEGGDEEFYDSFGVDLLLGGIDTLAARHSGE
ncbi:TetR family transcriptional regulator [Nonomuraea sp. NPDC046570]|uniref:TetR/AcrR family transcriptional regulator n=1 Tax=Nonomuraea sp. NPDC046570 TaxID=3155255 RepID=UPI0033E8EEB3